MSKIMNRKAPYIFEDGNQTRDLIYISDIVNSILLALKKRLYEPVAINIGTGKPISILELARNLVQRYGTRIQPIISSDFRRGDVRHCYADNSRAKKLLGFEPKVSLEEGLEELVRTSRLLEVDSSGQFEESLLELKAKRLVGVHEQSPLQA